MAKFIKLTKDNGKIIMLNMDLARSVSEDKILTTTLIDFGDDFFFRVQETPEEIMKLLGGAE